MIFKFFNNSFAKISTNGSSRFQICVSILIAVIVLCFLIFYRSQLIAALLNLDIRWVLAGLFCYGFNYFLRAVRLDVLSRWRINIWPNAIYASSLHGFVTYLLPLQFGDLSLPIILKNSDNIKLSEGSAILVRTRLLDMVSLGTFMIAAALMSDIRMRISLRVAWILIGCFLFTIPLVVHRVMTCKWMQSQRFGGFLKPFVEVGKFSANEYLLSLGIWTSIASMFFCVAKAVNLHISFGEIWLLLSIQLPLQMIPIQGLANTGNHEAGWIAALSLIGIPVATAAKFAVTSHIIILCYVLLLGIVPLFVNPKNQIDFNA
jgi:uncharacterized membrane protein YbhN (UPF0104 family)